MDDLARIDLNLLLAFDALLAERNVTRAAKRIGVAQSSMSHALARLRDLFEDPILVRTSRGMVPTPRAEEMETPMRNALEQIRNTVRLSASFDPSDVTVTFSIATDGVQQTALFPRLLQVLSKSAPGISLCTLRPTRASSTYARLRSGVLDAAIGPFNELPSGIHYETLGTDRIVYVMRKQHPQARNRLTREAYFQLPQILFLPMTQDEIPPDFKKLFRELGLPNTIIAQTPDPLAAMLIVSRADLICAAAELIVEPFKDALGLVIHEPPVRFPPYETKLVWHERTHDSPLHRWLRETIIETSRVCRAQLA